MAEDIKYALEYAVGLEQEKVHIIENEYGTFTDKKLERINPREEGEPEVVTASTLGSLVDFLHGNHDKLPFDALHIQVLDTKNVVLEGILRNDWPRKNERDRFFMSKAITPEITFNRFMPVEHFKIMLQSGFRLTNDKDAVMGFLGAMKIGDGMEIRDNGIAQTAVIKTGVAGLDVGLVPNPVILQPYRTFAEVEQAASEFVFRVNDKGEAGLWEADGGMWRVEAIANIKQWLREKLAEVGVEMMIIG